MTHRRSTYFGIVVLTIACVNLWPVSASRPELVKISATNLGVAQCIQPKNEDSREERSKLRVRFSITNVSDQPLIIYRQAPAIFNLRIVKREIDFPKVAFNYERQPTFNCAPPLNFEAAAPGGEFQILQPNESLTYEPEGLLFADTTSSERKRRLEGDSL